MTQHGQRVQGRGRAVGVRAVMEEAAAAAAAAATAALGPGPGPRGLGAEAGRREGGSRGRGEEGNVGLRGRFVGKGPLSSTWHMVGRRCLICLHLPCELVKATSSLPEIPPGRRDLKRVRPEPESVPGVQVIGAGGGGEGGFRPRSLAEILAEKRKAQGADAVPSASASSASPGAPGASRGTGAAGADPASAIQSRPKAQLVRAATAGSAAKAAGERAQTTAPQNPTNGSREAASATAGKAASATAGKAASATAGKAASATAGKAVTATAGKAVTATAGKAAPVTAGGAGGLFSGPRPLSELLKRKRASDEGGGDDGGVAGSGAQQERAAGERQRRVARVDVTGGQGEGNVGKTRRLTRVLSGRGGGEVGTKAARMGEGTGAEVSGTGAEATGGEATAAGTEAAGSENEDVEKAVGPVAATAPVSAPAAAVVEEEKVGHAPDATLADDADDGIILVRSGSSQSKGERAEGEVDLGDELVDEEDEDYDLEGKLGDLW
ncbi:unnamed protein product [Closterium sp. NIES-64]|nr:unnamed protein product [Closterium sp. NIES-64]